MSGTRNEMTPSPRAERPTRPPRSRRFPLAAGASWVARHRARRVLGPACVGLVASLSLMPGPAGAATSERVYERVSPSDKEGSRLARYGTFQAAPSGDGIVFGATGPFAGAQTSLYRTYYVAKRGEEDWGVTPIDPPTRSVVPSSSALRRVVYLSDELDRAIVVSSEALAPGAVEGNGNVYLWDADTGERSLIVTHPRQLLLATLTTGGSVTSIVATPDLSKALMTSPVSLLPPIPPFGKAVYVLSGPGLADLSLAAGPSGPGEPPQSWIADPLSQVGSANRTISNDGNVYGFEQERVLWAVPYLRVGDAPPVPLAVSRVPGDDLTPGIGQFIAVSDDGNIVYFRSDGRLLPEDDGVGVGLYKLELDTDTLTYLTDRKSGASPFETIGAYVPTGSGRFYFTSPNNFLDGMEDVPDLNGDDKLYVHDERGTRLVTELGPGAAFGSQAVKTSENGRYLVFMAYTEKVMAGFDNANPRCKSDHDTRTLPGLCTEIYVFDAVEDELTCVSCVHVGDKNRNSRLSVSINELSGEYSARGASNDGAVVFTSDEALVPEDVNGRRDVYEWHEGDLRLVSPGNAPHDAEVLDMSADGQDVFFWTTERLVPSDVDDAPDVYDARVGGGLAAQQVLPEAVSGAGCEGDLCQGDFGASPGRLRLGSGVVDGAGDRRSHRVGPVRAALIGGSVRRGSFELRVRLPRSGVVTVAGPGIRKRRVRTGTAGAERVRVWLADGARRTLKRRGRLRTRLVLTLRTAAGETARSRVVVTLAASRASTARAR